MPSKNQSRDWFRFESKVSKSFGWEGYNNTLEIFGKIESLHFT